MIRKRKSGVDADKNALIWVYMVWSIVAFQTFLTLYSSSTVLLDPIKTRLTAGIYTVIIPLSIVGALQVAQWIPKVNSLFIMSGLLISITIAQRNSDPDRESKIRQRAFQCVLSSIFLVSTRSTTASTLRNYIEDRSSSIAPVHVFWFEQSHSNQMFHLLQHRNFYSMTN